MRTRLFWLSLTLSFAVPFSVTFFVASAALAGEIGYIESFALSKDRAEAIKLLIPGSEDYYYYSCLHHQQLQQFDEVDALLGPWVERYGNTPRIAEIKLRQALLTYDRNPKKSLEAIRRHLQLQFNHQRELLGEKPNLPSELDPQRISRATLIPEAHARFQNLDGFEDSALDWLVSETLTPEWRRSLLQRLNRPDYPNLPKLIVDDLAYRNSSPFGSFGIHQQLLREQLDELLKLQPDLLNQQDFVQIYLTKLQPGADSDWQRNPQEKAQYLDRVWAFVQRLAPVHNSLKANVLYHRLSLDRTQGLYDKNRFLTYLRLPRNAGYVARDFLQLEENRRFAADLNANFQDFILLPPVFNDEPLVREFLHHFFIEESVTRPYEPYVNDVYLRERLAETKIVHGLGNPEQWYALLSPAAYQQLKERIDLDFVPTNRVHFAAEEPVTLDVDIKNVRTLIVKVFEVNTRNYYQQHHQEVNTDINLDGLVANEEQTFDYSDPPLRRVRRHFEFPSLSRPGVYVIDFIGNGMSSRAVIRKGQLRHLVETTTAGHLFTILDEKNQVVTDATLWLAGREYAPDQQGRIRVPFTEKPGQQPIVISRGLLSSLETFQYEAENYELRTGFYVDRESLLSRRTAELLIRPSLYLNGTPVSLKVLENIKLTMVSTDLDGTATTKEVPSLKLFEDREATYELQTPPRLASITFSLSAQVQNLSQNKKVDVSASQSFTLNSIDKTDKVEDLHLLKVDGRYALEVLGKTGEARADRAIQFSLKHRDFRHPVQFALKTDQNGRIALGSLVDIDSVTATGPEGTAHTWSLRGDRHTYYQAVHGRAGQPAEVPWLPPVTADKAANKKAENEPLRPRREDVSLLEIRGGQFSADFFEKLILENGMLVARDLPAGDYDLWLKKQDRHITVRVAAGERREGYVLGDQRFLEVRGEHPLQIADVTANDQSVEIRLHNATPFSRVHVIATRFLPAYDLFEQFSRITDTEPYRIHPGHTDARYMSGRNIGDEYRYIIDRKFAQRFPGVMLDRPSLLLNPWSVRTTQTERQDAEAGNNFAPAAPAPSSEAAREAADPGAAGKAAAELTSNLDFLGESSVVLENLVPDESGKVVIPRQELLSHQHLHIVAVDPTSTAYRAESLPEQAMKFRDLRLANGLDPLRHYTQQKQITIVPAGSVFQLNDIVTAKFEAYDSLARVYALYTTLSGNPQLAEFSFLLQWPKLSREEKQAKYSKYACHELNFFLFRRDPEFFDSVVKPYLANKMDRTFLDQWLLGESLDGYLSPWNYEQLNVVERILLARRVAADAREGARDVVDRFHLLPPDIERFNSLFRTAIRSSALDTSDNLGLMEAAEQPVQELNFGAMGGMGGGGLSGAGRTAGLAEKAAEPQARRNALSRSLGGAVAQDVELSDKLEASGKVLSERFSRMQRQGNAAGLGLQVGEAWMKSSDYYFDNGVERKKLRQLFEQLDKTQEWAENNYYKLPIEQQVAELVGVNAFWRDLAQHDGKSPFLSTNFAYATGNFTEMMFALALLDLPFEAGEHKSEYEQVTMKLTAASPLIAFHEEIRPAATRPESTPILVSQNFFHAHDRYRFESNEQLDKFVTEEFLTHTVYGCQVVVTNPTSAPQKLDVLTQIPAGALIVNGGEATRSVHVQLQPFSTQTVEYYFYFPATGKFPHYPVHVAKNEQLLAHAEPFSFTVVEQLSRLDRESWEYVSQFGTDEQVLEFLRTANLHRLNLEKIAFRMQDRDYFLTVVDLLTKRHAYNQTLWSYAIKHDVPHAVNEFLQHHGEFVASCGDYLDSTLLTIDPVARKTYQQLDYLPLVNARAHQLGRRRQILNDRFSEQYHSMLKVLGYKRALNDEDRMVVTYYLLLQDRIEDASEFFAAVNADNLTTRMQYDYFAAYFHWCRENAAGAEQIAAKYSNHPVDRWRNTFSILASQVDEMEGSKTEVLDPENRNQVQTQLAATEPSLDFQVEAKQIKLNYQHLERVTVNYYLMDIELLFSRNPFVQTHGSQFSNIRPNLSQTLELRADQSHWTFELPEKLRNSNVLVEITSRGITKSQPYYANSLAVRMTENYGQLQIVTANPGQALSKVYVKAYARMKDGSVRFYKDGYTDLRGRFDYASLNTNELDFVDKFALLIMSDDHGAVIREANPPLQ